MRQAGKSFKFSLWQESPLSSLLIRTSAKRTKRIAIYTGFAECLHDRFLQLQTSSEILPLKMGDVWQILFVNTFLTVKGGKRLQATCHLWWTEAPQKGQRLSRCLIKIQNDFGERDWRNATTWMEGTKRSMASSYRRRSQMSQRLQKQEEFITPTKPIRCHLQSGEQSIKGINFLQSAFKEAPFNYPKMRVCSVCSNHASNMASGILRIKTWSRI